MSTKLFGNASNIAKKWTEIICCAFEKGVYDHNVYSDTYKKIYGLPPKGGLLLDFSNFYQISLVSDNLEDKTASALMDYILHKKTGIYYIYDRQLSILPEVFKSKEASKYIAAIELLSEYKNPGCKEKLMFVVEWLNTQKEGEGYWDMGTTVKDGVRFPLSNSWRKKELRVKDCTYRISRLMKNLVIDK